MSKRHPNCLPTPRFDSAHLCHHCSTLRRHLETPLSPFPNCLNDECPGGSKTGYAHCASSCHGCGENEWWAFWICWACDAAKILRGGYGDADEYDDPLDLYCRVCVYTRDGACGVVWKKTTHNHESGEVEAGMGEEGAVDMEELARKFGTRE